MAVDFLLLAILSMLQGISRQQQQQMGYQEWGRERMIVHFGNYLFTVLISIKRISLCFLSPFMLIHSLTHSLTLLTCFSFAHSLAVKMIN